MHGKLLRLAHSWLAAAFEQIRQDVNRLTAMVENPQPIRNRERDAMPSFPGCLQGVCGPCGLLLEPFNNALTHLGPIIGGWSGSNELLSSKCQALALVVCPWREKIPLCRAWARTAVGNGMNAINIKWKVLSKRSV